VPARDAEAVARALWTYLGDPARARSVGRSNRQVVVRDFSWRRSARRLLDVYELAAA
jgi:glycosyltransferase involved in cell wall biosynthesis